MINITTTDRSRNLSNRHETQLRRSAEVTAALRRRSEGAGWYEQIQRTERLLRQKKAAFDASVTAIADGKVAVDTARKALMMLCRSVAGLCEANGSMQARDVLESDASDEQAIAANLVEYVKIIPHAGPGLVEVLRKKRLKWLAVEAAFRHWLRDYEEATQGYDAAYYNAAAEIAQARALLYSLGVRVGERKAKRAQRGLPQDGRAGF